MREYELENSDITWIKLQSLITVDIFDKLCKIKRDRKQSISKTVELALREYLEKYE